MNYLKFQEWIDVYINVFKEEELGKGIIGERKLVVNLNKIFLQN